MAAVLQEHVCGVDSVWRWQGAGRAAATWSRQTQPSSFLLAVAESLADCGSVWAVTLAVAVLSRTPRVPDAWSRPMELAKAFASRGTSKSIAQQCHCTACRHTPASPVQTQTSHTREQSPYLSTSEQESKSDVGQPASLTLHQCCPGKVGESTAAHSSWQQAGFITGGCNVVGMKGAPCGKGRIKGACTSPALLLGSWHTVCDCK